MKIIKFLIISLIVLISIIVVGGYVFIKYYNFDKLRPYVIEQARKNIHRDIDFKKLSFNVDWKGLSLAIDEFVIPDASQFGKEPLFTSDRIKLGLEVSELIKKRISINRIEVVKPILNLIINEDSTNNLQQLAADATSSAPSDNASPISEKPTKAQPKAVSDFQSNLVITKALISEGMIGIQIKNKEGDKKLSLKSFNFELNDFAFNTFSNFTERVSFLSEKPNVKTEGQLLVNINNNEVVLKNVKTTMEINQEVLDALSVLVPELTSAKLNSPVNFIASVDLTQAVINPSKEINLNGKISMNNASIKTVFLENSISNIDVNIAFDNNQINIKEISCEALNGNINLEGIVSNYIKQPDAQIKLAVSNLNLSDSVYSLNLPIELGGLISSDFELTADPKIIHQGSGHAVVKEGQIKNLNLLKFILSQLSFIPNLEQKVNQSLPKEYEEVLKRENTVFDNVTADFLIRDNQVSMDKLIVESSGLVFQSIATLNINNMEINLAAELLMAKDLSQKLFGGKEDLAYLLDQNGQLRVPFKPYQGPIAKIRTYPDIEDMAKGYLKNRGQSELKNLLYKALDIDESAPNSGSEPNNSTPNKSESGPSSESSPSDSPEQNQEAPPEKVLIDNVLNAIFK